MTKSVISKTTEAIISEDTAVIARKQSEMKAGITPDGSPIGIYRPGPYRLFKMQLNPIAGGKVDWILTGATKNALRVVPLGNGKFKIESADPKWAMLMANPNYNTEEMTGINKDVFRSLQQSKYGPMLNNELKLIANIQ